jgi:hypothetical protein
MKGTTMLLLIASIVYVAVLVFMLALCRAAKRADRWAELQYQNRNNSSNPLADEMKHWTQS